MKTENYEPPVNINIDYSIRSLTVKRFAYNENAIDAQTLRPAILSTEDLQHLQIQGNIKHKFAAPNIFSVIFDFTLAEPTNSTEPIVTTLIEAQYNVKLFTQQPDGSRTYLDESESSLPIEFVRMLASASYSATRGVLWSKLGGTPLQSYLLPMIDPQLLISASPMQGEASPEKPKRKIAKKISR